MLVPPSTHLYKIVYAIGFHLSLGFHVQVSSWRDFQKSGKKVRDTLLLVGRITFFIWVRIQSKHLLSLIRPKKERRVLQNWRQRIRTNRTSKGRSRKADLYLLLFLLLLTLIDWSSRGYSQTLSSCVCASLCTSPTSFVFPNTWETGKRYLTSHTLMTLTLYCVLVEMMSLAFRSKNELWSFIYSMWCSPQEIKK